MHHAGCRAAGSRLAPVTTLMFVFSVGFVSSVGATLPQSHCNPNLLSRRDLGPAGWGGGEALFSVRNLHRGQTREAVDTMTNDQRQVSAPQRGGVVPGEQGAQAPGKDPDPAASRPRPRGRQRRSSGWPAPGNLP